VRSDLNTEEMGEFTKAVFDSKEFFDDGVMKEFAECDSSRSRLQFVNAHVPRHVTDFLRIDGSPCVLINDNEPDQESLTRDKQCTPSLMTPHQRFPTLSQGISVEYQKDRGRFLRANKKIKRGEIVAVESPIAAFPVIKECEDYCNTCFKVLSQGTEIQHCDSCQLVSWCSKDCKARAMRTHHRYECRVRFPDLVKQGHPGIGKLFMIFRIFSQRSVKYFRENRERLLEHHPSSGAGIEDSLMNDYNTLFNLARHLPEDQAKILEVTIVSLVFVRMLEVVGYFTDNVDQDILSPDQEMVGELISVLIPIINVNTHPLHDVSSDNQNKTVCAAVYPVIAALFNHSCDPSLVRATWGDKLVLAAGRDIMVGEELTDMYTVHWTEYSTQERKDYLERVFHFCCCCKACIEGWEPVEDEKPGALELGVQRRLAAHHMREQAEHRLMYFIADKLE